MKNEYKVILNELKSLGLFQFKSSISGSQYITAYNIVKKYFKNNFKVLDWGAGNLHFSYFLLKNNYMVNSFSLSQEDEISKILKQEFKNTFNNTVNSNAQVNLPFENNTFDAVTSIGVLEHVKEVGGNEYESLKEIKRILKDGGIFFCYHFPNKYSWIEFLTKYIGSKYSHQNKYTKSQIINFANTAGFKILEIKKYGFLPRLMFRNLNTPTFLTEIFNTADKILSAIFRPICQNYYFVFIKCM